MIALAIVLRPAVLVADEPTTALDVIVEAQVLAILTDSCERYDTALLLITHNLGLVAESCDRVAVMYAGKIVEEDPYARCWRSHSIRIRGPFWDRRLRLIPPSCITFREPRQIYRNHPPVAGFILVVQMQCAYARSERRSVRNRNDPILCPAGCMVQPS